MAVSGLILLGFVILHLLGNLLIFAGPDALNGYAQKLRQWGVALWAARAFLLAALAIHVWTSIALTRENRRARPLPYSKQHLSETTLAARTMVLSGLLLLFFITYHLLHLTFRLTNPDISHALDALGRHDVYTMVVMSFRVPAITFVYVLGMAALCFHLAHGLSSSCQTLGLNDERSIPAVERMGQFFAVALFIGYSSIPLAVLLGLIGNR